MNIKIDNSNSGSNINGKYDTYLDDDEGKKNYLKSRWWESCGLSGIYKKDETDGCWNQDDWG